MIAGFTATGTDLATACPLPSRGDVMTFDVQTVPAGSGVVMPQEVSLSALVLIRNSGANALLVYPESGGTINGATTALSVAAAGFLELWSLSGNDWVTR